MEAHLKRIKEVWEKYQENISEKKGYSIKLKKRICRLKNQRRIERIIGRAGCLE